MADIYQQIWDADQAHAGLRAVKKGQPIDAATRDHGYVVVDEAKNAGPEHRLLVELVIPPGKAVSYKRVEVLFNNYTLDQTKPEVNFPDEEREVQAFIEAVYKTPPMEVARGYVSTQAGRSIATSEWWSILERVWFEQFDMGSNKDLSGFEHVIVGEQKQGKVQGYHFWYKYYLDENFRTDDEVVDTIKFLRWEGKPGDTSPDVATLSYQWQAFDYERKVYRKLTKPIGGFWIGPSVEGLMAMGTVRCLAEALAPKKAVINDARYNLPLYRSPNDRNLRTFYPEFAEMVA
jgi:poly(U)-specific endoribonuclease